MPKRKRVQSVSNWCFGIESDCDLMDKQNDEELKTIIDNKLLNNCVNNDESIVESQIQNSIETEIIDKNRKSSNSNDNEMKCNSKSRRKSNRISKPIQRSIDTSPNPSISIKKIALKQNSQALCVTNCESEKVLVKAKSDETNKSSTSKGKSSKSLRKLQMWTEDDTKWFFEAICEHGKDFPRIQSYMAQRCEKKGIPQDVVKNYEQVRHYYYRMWHKIANSLNISNVVDKGIQEVYGLVNYGEIWKKFNSKFDSKLGLHLQQLVNFGHTIFKVKGKSVRVKTPVCNALKKMHKINVSEKTKTNNNQNLLNLPKEVCIELHPATNESWLRVHSLSQNPRVRTKLSLQKRLSTLIEYLEKRWKPSRIRDSECRTLYGTSLPNAFPPENTCLRVRPHISGDLKNVSLSKSFFNSQIDLSLTAYLKNLYNDELKSSGKKIKANKMKDKINDESIADGSMKSPNNEQNNDCCDDKNKSDAAFKSDEEEPIAEAERSLALLKMLASMNATQNELSEEIHATDEEEDEQNKDEDERDGEEVPSPDSTANVFLPEPPANATLAQWLSGKDDDQEEYVVNEDDKKEVQNTSETTDHISRLSAERARKGWSLTETGSMTIGELYLLFRCPKIIVLEYMWEPITQMASNPGEEQSHKSNEDLSAKDLDNKDMVSDSDSLNDDKDLIQKLLLAANVSLMSSKRSSNSSAQTQKKKRIKPTPAPILPKDANNSSQLLSTVISKTIFNDNSDNNNKIANNLKDISSRVCETETKSSHNFIVPTSPAPKAVNKAKGRAVCGDPALIQEALRQLQSNRYTRRQRRPAPKPVFGQNKPLLPRGSASCVPSNSSQNGSPPQPIYVLPSRPLHINTITTVGTHSSNVTLPSSVLTQTLPVVANVNMTAINTNLAVNQLQTSIQRSIDSENSFDMILPQKASQSDSKIQNVSSFIDSIKSSNSPLMQNVSHLLEPINSVSNQSINSLQLLEKVGSPFTESSPVICSKTIPLTQTNSSDNNNNQNKNIQTLNVDSNINQVLVDNQCMNASEESSDKLPSLPSTPTISSLLEISLPDPPFGENSCSSLTNTYNIEKRPFESLSLPDISSNLNAITVSTDKIRTSSTDPTLPTSTATSSLPSPPIDRHKLSSLDSQWLNGESCDLSIGTLLNACESPVKSVQISSNSLNNDVDTQMSCLATDNSVDLMAKFADLAAQMADSNSKST